MCIPAPNSFFAPCHNCVIAAMLSAGMCYSIEHVVTLIRLRQISASPISYCFRNSKNGINNEYKAIDNEIHQRSKGSIECWNNKVAGQMEKNQSIERVGKHLYALPYLCTHSLFDRIERSNGKNKEKNNEQAGK